MVYYLPITISNRTAAQIRIKHSSFTDLILPHQNTFTKAIPSSIKIKNLKISVSIQAEKPNEIQISFLKKRRFRKNKRFWKLKIDYCVNQVNQMLEKGKRSRYEVFQSISDDGSITLMAITARDFSSWMSRLPDSPSLSALTLPGTHQTCALYGWPIGTCQTRTLSRQLKDGIRFLDIRLGLPQGPSSQLVAFHGVHSQSITFQEILQILIKFITDQPSETIIVSIKQEDHKKGFKEAVIKEMIEFEGMESFKNHWWLDGCLPPSLGEARGKLVLFSRIEDETDTKPDTNIVQAACGVRLASWPNNSKEIWETQIADVNVAVQDWYNIGSLLAIPQKSSLACVSLCRALHEPSAPVALNNEVTHSDGQPDLNRQFEAIRRPEEYQSEGSTPTWVINFLSASSLLLAFPVICAKGFGCPKFGVGIEGVNSRVARWLVNCREEEGGPSVKGVVCMMDYYQSPKEALVSLLVDCNF